MDKDLANLYDVPDIPAGWNFELLGHTDHGLDTFPQWVVPIGRLEGRPAAIYNQMEVRGVVRADYMESLNGSTLYDEGLRERLSGFDFRNDYLFAYANDDVVSHDNAGRVEFVREVLSDERFQDTSPHLRLIIAHGSGNRELIIDELRKYVKYVGADSTVLSHWYESEIRLLRRPVDELGYGMPELAAELERPGMLESLIEDSA